MIFSADLRLNIKALLIGFPILSTSRQIPAVELKLKKGVSAITTMLKMELIPILLFYWLRLTRFLYYALNNTSKTLYLIRHVTSIAFL